MTFIDLSCLITTLPYCTQYHVLPSTTNSNIMSMEFNFSDVVTCSRSMYKYYFFIPAIPFHYRNSIIMI